MKIPLVVDDTSELALTPQQFKMLGMVFGALGLVLFIASYFIASSITTHQAAAATQVIAQAKECQTRLEGLGFKVTSKANTISAEASGLDDAAYKLGQASIASLSCQGWALAKFCMGEGCGPKGGVQFDLQPNKSSS